jgi:hemoglobin-like flavoprotein
VIVGICSLRERDVTPRQTRLVRETLDLMHEDAGAIALLFYGRLFELEPSLQRLFIGDLRRQSRKMMDMLEATATCLDDWESVRPRLRNLGELHMRYGVQPQHYAIVTSALLWAFGHALGQEFTREAREAWAQVLARISCEMQGIASVRAALPER